MLMKSGTVADTAVLGARIAFRTGARTGKFINTPYQFEGFEVGNRWLPEEVPEKLITPLLYPAVRKEEVL